jgi:hypothetical protein
MAAYLKKGFPLYLPRLSPNKNIISLAISLGQLLAGRRFAQYSQQVIAPYVKRYMRKENHVWISMQHY